MRCSTGIHFRTTSFSSLYQQSSVCFRSSWSYFVCWNLFYSNKDIKTVFLKVNNELQKINESFISNKLSLNVKKNKYLFFHKPSEKDDIPLVLPKLNINNREIARTESIKFLGVLLEENLSWKTHKKYIENKISKNISILFKTRLFLNKKSLLSL